MFQNFLGNVLIYLDDIVLGLAVSLETDKFFFTTPRIFPSTLLVQTELIACRDVERLNVEVLSECENQDGFQNLYHI
jgi:hypothetical protein